MRLAYLIGASLIIFAQGLATAQSEGGRADSQALPSEVLRSELRSQLLNGFYKLPERFGLFAEVGPTDACSEISRLASEIADRDRHRVTTAVLKEGAHEILNRAKQWAAVNGYSGRRLGYNKRGEVYWSWNEATPQIFCAIPPSGRAGVLGAWLRP